MIGWSKARQLARLLYQPVPDAPKGRLNIYDGKGNLALCVSEDAVRSALLDAYECGAADQHCNLANKATRDATVEGIVAGLKTGLNISNADS